ncbi:2-amino-4-hydroxy-6-hydroxymethyldihydropteridine diphosphokinase [Luteimonas sp. e5]
MSARAYVGLGGNVGDVPATLRAALAALDALPGTRLAAVSGFYRSAPVGGIAQDDFVNAVAALDTTLPPTELLQALFAIERAHGRDRRRERRWGPRTLDLDLLLHGDAVIETDGLTLPHPRMAQRAFVLRPLAEIAPEACIPGIGDVTGLLEALGEEQRLERLPDTVR